jgi:long-chain acyl-CoA synthetase
VTVTQNASSTRWWWKDGPGPSNLAEIIDQNARRTPERVVLSRRDRTGWQPVTAAQFRDEVRAVALGLLAAGVEPGDRVALMSKTRYEWQLVDFAIWSVGAVTVPVYETSSAEQLRWILTDSAAVAAVVESAGHARLLTGLGDLPDLRASWRIEAGSGSDLPSLDDLVASGRDQDASELDRRIAALRPEDLATLIYTSGTTGRPKGCELSHANFIAEITAAVDCLPELFEDDDAATLLFLPLAHVFGRMIGVAVMLAAVRTGHTDVARVTKDLPTFKPTFVLAVPRVFERIYDSAQRKAAAGGKERIFAMASDTAIAYSRALENGGRPGLRLSFMRGLFDRLVYSKIKEAFGGQLRWGVSGGAALGPRLGHFFRGIGVTVLEGYGLTETTAATTVNTRSHTRMGTVGRPLPGFEVRTSDSGEILVRGGHVFGGYWRNPEATAEAVDADGWFHTGDLGTVDADGFLTITGRSKEILVTSAGKNVSPAPLEDVVRSHVLVSQALVVGDGRPSIGALVTLDAESLEPWLADRGRAGTPVAELTEDPELLAEIRTAIDAANETVSAAEQIARFRVLPVDFTEDGGQLTPTLKIKRAVVMEQFADDVEALYAKRTR